MKKKLQIIISQLRAEWEEQRQLPALLSPEARLNHLIEVALKLQPERIIVIAGLVQPYQPAGKTARFILVQPEEAPGKGQPAGYFSRLKIKGEVLLLSTEFFPVNQDVLLQALKTHREGGYRLTFLAGKQKAENERDGQNYFVYPGLAVLDLDQEAGRFVLEKCFKLSGELNVVGLTDYLKPDYDGLGFDWVGDKDQAGFISILKPDDWPQAASILNRQKIAGLEEKGVLFFSPEETWIDPRVQIGRGSVIYPWVLIEGQTRIGSNCLIYPHCHIIDSQLGDRVKVFSSTVIEGSRIEKAVQVGPFSRLRPGTRLKAGSRVGNFVEMKKTVFGQESKAMHLSYLGDALVGEKVNIGAGTITCNYDGRKKNKTTIGREVFVGSGTELVAPVKVGRGAYIAAGSTITDNVSPEALAIARSRQVEKKGWVKRRQELMDRRNKRK
jgi:bifunctional UDP-N-acetylglucosamine pyrophosphorylase/glucosamine-1-phosphate N-acetyltransferase